MPDGDKVTDDGFIEMPQPEVPDESGQDEPQLPEVPESGEPEGTDGDTPAPEPEKTPPPFKFADEEPAEGEAKPFMVIKHNGREIPIENEEQARNLVQKGFDYDYKVGPHGKLAQIMNEYPDFSQIVAQEWNRYLMKLQGVEQPQQPTQPESKSEPPQLKPLAEYENANDWLRDNIEILQKASQPPKQTSESQSPQMTPEVYQRYLQSQQAEQQLNQVMMSLASRDPQNFHKIAPNLQRYAQQMLTKEQYDLVNNSYPHMVQFYDYVRDNVVKNQGTSPKAKPAAQPSFRVSSGGGQAPEPDNTPPWEKLNNEDFESFMAKVKGLSNYK